MTATVLNQKKYMVEFVKKSENVDFFVDLKQLIDFYDPKPMTQQEFYESIAESENDIKEGRVSTLEEMKKRFLSK
jgi:cellulose biosynthesis protein BcsQ